MAKTVSPPQPEQQSSIACTHKFSGPRPEKPAAQAPVPARAGFVQHQARASQNRSAAARKITSIPDISGTNRDFPKGHDNPGGIPLVW